MRLNHLTVISSMYLFLKIDLLISVEAYSVRAALTEQRFHTSTLEN